MYCVLDLETTGINQFEDQPIEIGAILVDQKFQIVDKFHSYIRISENLKFSDSAKKTHGLKEIFLKGKPDQEQVLEDFFRRFGTNFRFVAWNMTFDIGFFKRMCFENGFGAEFDKVNYRHLDLQTMFFFYCQQRGLHDLISLNDACKHFNIPRSNYHSALEDADITYKVFKNLMLLK